MSFLSSLVPVHSPVFTKKRQKLCRNENGFCWKLFLVIDIGPSYHLMFQFFKKIEIKLL
ncbi:MAG: hypothetical protein Satyrvirus7_11 [Satyrvirus sp.]|uniref:Uncharacterized protein n=1 Tax=Satyrvirus sp. TaxID=2487771 RepID=A0A3G5ADH5_9VIRU|nr:MAG: hypothetical protein Satyrvirus7_11 [Satyrvirus sp.]